MSRLLAIVTLVLCSSLAFLVGLSLAGRSNGRPGIETSVPRRAPDDRVRPASAAPRSTMASFADVTERINAAVVNIDASANTPPPRSQRLIRPGSDDGDAMREFDRSRPGSGSGFLSDRTGFILTNNHVIETAQRITVTLADGRTFRAEVVGADTATDVALLRVDGPPDFPAAPLGNSDDLRVGEWVCAIGNPLGYVHSVTVGVVSFIGRKLFDPSLDDYIQTDAAINFGNSGGPLINARGQVIGINAAISSRASNIGFAVPINQAVGILPQLKTTGHVSRGYMGVLLIDVTPALQHSLSLSASHGALVQDVTGGSPAERAGLHTYDVILDVEGRDIASNEELIREISARQPGTTARLGVMRDARRLTLHVKLAERPARDEPDRDGLDSRTRPRIPEPVPDAPLGLTVRELDRGFIGRLEVPDSVHGVIVSRVDPTGAAFSASERRGFVIMEINRKPIRSVADYQRVIAAAKPGEILALYCYDPTLTQRALITVTVE